MQRNNKRVSTYTAEEQQDYIEAMHGCSVVNWLKYSVSLGLTVYLSSAPGEVHQAMLNQSGLWRTASAGQSLSRRAHDSVVETRKVSTKTEVTIKTKKLQH